MSDETPPKDDIREVLEQLRAKAASELQEAIQNGGKKTVRHRCPNCGEQSNVEYTTMDPDMLVKSLSSSSAALKALGDDKADVSTEAVKLIRDRSEMTDAELAEYIARLRAERDEVDHED